MTTGDMPSKIRGLLEWWLAEIRSRLGENLHAAVLFGSVTLGDYSPGWSDAGSGLPLVSISVD